MHEGDALGIDGRAQPPGGLVEHLLGTVEGDHMGVGQPIEDCLGHPSAAAAGVEHSRQPIGGEVIEEGRGPAGLGVGHAVIAGGIPLAGAHPAVVGSHGGRADS